MTPAKYTYTADDDWAALYQDDKLIMEGHPSDVLLNGVVRMLPNIDEFQSEGYLEYGERRANYPASLKELKEDMP